MFNVGQHVVCVDDRPPEELGILPGPGGWIEDDEWIVRGRVYTVRGFVPDWFDGDLTVLLAELHRSPVLGVEPYEVGFDARRFRPLKDSSLDVFREALNSAPTERAPSSSVPVRNRTEDA